MVFFVLARLPAVDKLTHAEGGKPKRAEQALIRRRAIVDAALDEFIEKGFAATRVDDIARRAGVAKGTIYLNFKDKEALFEAIVQQEIRPKMATAEVGPVPGETLCEFAERVMVPLVADILNSRRAAIIRLLVGEAGRFPKLAEVYFRVVIEPGLAGIRALIRGAMERGEIRGDMLAHYPQLMIAPAVFSVIWSGLFQRFSPLDIQGMLREYFQHVLTCGDGENRDGKQPGRGLI